MKINKKIKYKNKNNTAARLHKSWTRLTIDWVNANPPLIQTPANVRNAQTAVTSIKYTINKWINK